MCSVGEAEWVSTHGQPSLAPGSDLRYTSESDGRLSRKRFMVRLGRWDGTDNRGEKKPRLAVSIAEIASKLKELLSSCCGDENSGRHENSDSDLLRLRSILAPAVGGSGVVGQAKQS